MLGKEGKRVPQVTFRIFEETLRQDVSTTDLFANKTVIVFAVPGAFTCPSSPIQVLGYNEYAKVFQANGIDEIVCVSVNDPFALAHWAKEEGADHIRFMPDVNGAFTREMGMLVNLSDKGMGQRSRRYSMLVKDGIIEKMFVETKALGVMPEVSNAETMLNYINPTVEKPEKAATLMRMWRAVLAA